MIDTPNVVKQRRRRERMRAAGFVLRQVWIHPEDWPLLRRKILRLRTEREKS